MPDYDVIQFVKIQLTLPDKLDPADEMSWQHYLYSKLGSKKGNTEIKPQQVDEVADRIVAMAKVLYGLHMVNNIFYTIIIFLIRIMSQANEKFHRLPNKIN